MRLFLAASLPEAITRPLNARLLRARVQAPPASWVQREAMHLTFAFLGEQSESKVKELAPLLTSSLAPLSRFEASLRGCGFFPNPRHARVGWVGAEPAEKFLEVATAIREAVREAGIEIDGEFRPHLTLMRIREEWPPPAIRMFETIMESVQSEPFPIEQVTLYSSRLRPEGPIHKALREFPLG